MNTSINAREAESTDDSAHERAETSGLERTTYLMSITALTRIMNKREKLAKNKEAGSINRVRPPGQSVKFGPDPN